MRGSLELLAVARDLKPVPELWVSERVAWVAGFGAGQLGLL